MSTLTTPLNGVLVGGPSGRLCRWPAEHGAPPFAMVLESTTNRVLPFDDSVSGDPAYML
jgi:hypothetical protein